MQLIRPKIADIPFIMATERIEGYEHLVGRSDEGWHYAALSDARFAYFLAKQGDEPIGFAILRDWASAEQVTHIKRVAVARPGQGLGKLFLNAVVVTRFSNRTKASSAFLGLFPDNLRARRAYERVGFKPEGVFCEAAPSSTASIATSSSCRFCARNGRRGGRRAMRPLQGEAARRLR